MESWWNLYRPVTNGPLKAVRSNRFTNCIRFHGRKFFRTKTSMKPIRTPDTQINKTNLLPRKQPIPMKTNLPLSPRSLKNRTGKTLSWLSAVAALIVLSIFADSCKKKDDPTPTVELSILSISPNTGSTGTAVTIVGTGFGASAADNEVTLNGKICPVTSAAATQLHITIPADAGTGPITVKVGIKTATSSTFTYLVPLAIASIAP